MVRRDLMPDLLSRRLRRYRSCRIVDGILGDRLFKLPSVRFLDRRGGRGIVQPPFQIERRRFLQDILVGRMRQARDFF